MYPISLWILVLVLLAYPPSLSEHPFAHKKPGEAQPCLYKASVCHWPDLFHTRGFTFFGTSGPWRIIQCNVTIEEESSSACYNRFPQGEILICQPKVHELHFAWLLKALFWGFHSLFCSVQGLESHDSRRQLCVRPTGVPGTSLILLRADRGRENQEGRGRA